MPAPTCFARYSPGTRTVHQDLLFGLACSLLVHGSLFLGGEFLSRSRPPRSRMDDSPAVTLEMPFLDEPEKPTLSEDQEAGDNSDAPSLAPPMQDDVPLTVPLDAFTQPIQPPSLPASRTARA